MDSNSNTTTPRWRGIKKSLGLKQEVRGVKRPPLNQKDSDLAAEDVDISLIQERTYLLSAGIGDTNKQYNRYKGKIGLAIWCINILIHFSLDFYEAWTIFGEAWATCIGLFLLTLVVCCISMIRHSIPWFLRGVKKLKKDGRYPKTLRHVRILVRFMPISTVVFAIGAAAGQFGCYAADGALRVNFNRGNTSIKVPQEVETLINVLRATSLIHVFYGFASLLLFHMTLVYMIQSSMKEFNERMGKLFREVPINIEFSEAVNSFSARAKFVREGSQKASIVLTTLLVACCTSSVLNAYNFLFTKKHAIYIWFALAPLIWAVAPLMGAAWITKTYWNYKLVVVNAWVDIPEEHELEAQAHSYLHQSNADKNGSKAAGTGMWGTVIINKNGKKDENVNGNVEEKDGIVLKSFKKMDEQVDGNRDSISVKNSTSLVTRRKSEIVVRDPTKIERQKKTSSSFNYPSKQTPTIMFSDYDGEKKTSLHKHFHPFARKVSDSSSDLQERTSDKEVVQESNLTASSAKETTRQVVIKENPRHVSIEIEPSSDDNSEEENGLSPSTSSSEQKIVPIQEPKKQSAWGRILGNKSAPGLKVPESDDGPKEEPPKGANLLSGISKTYHKWRTKTKKKKRFHYEKYIIYLESILPTVGFAVGGVIIDWNGIYTFIVVMTFLVGVFAQEAFFGN